MKFRAALVVALMMITASSLYGASATCWCKAYIGSSPDDQNSHEANVLYDLTNAVGLTFAGFNPQDNTSHRAACRGSCKGNAEATQQNIASYACTHGVADGRYIGAYATLGARPLQNDFFKKLVNRPADPVCKCPAGWMSNITNQNGDVSSDGKCKKNLGNILIPPFPPLGTPIGTWGFTWADGVYVWGTPENGGACSPFLPFPPLPRICKFE
jgi:hypothetical protein